MNTKEAYQILGLKPGSEPAEIKKQYRKLMMQVHPDSAVNTTESYHYTAQEINRAYSVLYKGTEKEREKKDAREDRQASKGARTAAWNAPVNRDAYRERDVLQNVEDYDGTVLGNFCVATGKYLWNPEEDFSLFLQSIYRCSKEILDEIDDSLDRAGDTPRRIAFQKDLVYLLTQQFIAGTDLLKELAKEEAADGNGQRIFYVPAMLEYSRTDITLHSGELLYPSAIKQHMLFLKDKNGQQVGYLSFHDDRLYYVIIPLLEQKAVQVKIQAAETPVKKRKANAKYHSLHLWLRLPTEVVPRMPENLNLQIDGLLERYRRNG
jgi:hypothetical protein